MIDCNALGERPTVLDTRPDPALAPYVAGYHLHFVGTDRGEIVSETIYPGWGMVRFNLTDEPSSVRIGSRRVDPLPRDALFGPSIRTGYSLSGSGVVIGAGLTPLGWARFIGDQAWKYADRVTPLASIIGEEAGRLGWRLAAGSDPKAVFDEFFHKRLRSRREEPREIARFLYLIEGGQVASVAELARRMGVEGRTLVRLSRSYFGFTPKVLLRRSRFLRTLAAVREAERGCWATCAEAAGYYDQSHFLRDCRLFLDMPLGRFLAHPSPRPIHGRRGSALFGTPPPSLRSAGGLVPALT